VLEFVNLFLEAGKCGPDGSVSVRGDTPLFLAVKKYSKVMEKGDDKKKLNNLLACARILVNKYT
jgi:hypothetical protein